MTATDNPVHIPTTIDEVTAEWVAAATGLAVTGVTSEIIGVGVGVSSAVYRLHLEGVDVPATLVLKLKAIDEVAAFTSATLTFYQRETGFFRELAHQVPIKVPKGYGGAVSEDGQDYYLFMEDMGGNRIVDQNEGMAISDAERAIDALALWHAKFWGQVDQYVESGTAMAVDHPIYAAVLPGAFTEGWEKIQTRIEMPPGVADVAPKWVDARAGIVNDLTSGPTTLLHGDYRADNILFDANGDVVLLDFQILSAGSPAYDVAYFITQSLLPEVAEEHEARLFERYVGALIEAGVDESETTGLWEDYRKAALYCIVYPVVACRGMDLDDPRQLELVNVMNKGVDRAVESLNLRELV